jgi:hypothetical protein
MAGMPFLDPRAMAGQGLPNYGSSPQASAAAVGMIPGVGDVTGLLQDGAMYLGDPSSRTKGNAMLTAAGMLPFFPAAATVKNLGFAGRGSPVTREAVLTWVLEEGGSVERALSALRKSPGKKDLEGVRQALEEVDEIIRFNAAEYDDYADLLQDLRQQGRHSVEMKLAYDVAKADPDAYMKAVGRRPPSSW